MQHDITLARGDIRLRPLSPDDAPTFRTLTDTASWAGMSTPLPADDEAMGDHLAGLVGTPGILAFAVEAGGEFVGRTTFYDLVPDLRVEIGNTIYAREVWGSQVNPACKLLLFTHAFDEWGLERVALRCDSRNVRSRGAIERLGARYEGTLRKFRRSADGTVTDADYFSVVREEWPVVRAGLEERLSR